MPAAQSPDERQHVERYYVPQCDVGHDVQCRAAARVGPSARTEKGKRRVDLARHQQPHEQQAKAAASDGPFLQVHLAARSGTKTDDAAHNDDEENDAHGSKAGGHRALSRFFFRRSSTPFASAIQPLLITIHATSQKRLKGRPRIIGDTRSHNGTEKHIPRKGTRPIARLSGDGFSIGYVLHLCYRKSTAITS